MVAERHPQLERVGHAEPIAHPKEIIGKVGLQIQTHGPVCRVLRRPSGKGRPVLVARRQRADLCQPFGREGRCPPLRRKEGDPPHVLLRQGTMAIGQKPLESPELVPASVALGKLRGEVSGHPRAEGLGRARVTRGRADAEVAGVPSEQLIPADSGQCHRDRTARDFRHQIGRDRRRVRERFAHRRHDARQQLDRIGTEPFLCVLGAKVAR